MIWAYVACFADGLFVGLLVWVVVVRISQLVWFLFIPHPFSLILSDMAFGKWVGSFKLVRASGGCLGTKCR